MRIDIFKKIVREIFSYGTYFNIVPKPNLRPNGISAMVKVYNEERYLEESIDSVMDFVDEIVVVDNGSIDGSWEKLNKIKEKNSKIKLYKFENKNFWNFSNYVIEKTSYRWLLKWDADFVAIVNKGKNELSFLKSFIDTIDDNIHYYFKIPLVELVGDFNHQFPTMRVRKDAEIFTYSDSARYIPVEKFFKTSPYPYKLPNDFEIFPCKIKMEGLKLPYYYRLGEIPRNIAFHLNIKPSTRYLIRYFWPSWASSNKIDNKEINELETYVKEWITKKWGFKNLEEAAKFFCDEMKKSLVEYDISLGNLPDNIKILAEKFYVESNI